MADQELQQQIEQAKEQIRTYGMCDPRSEEGVRSVAYNLALWQIIEGI